MSNEEDRKARSLKALQAAHAKQAERKAQGVKITLRDPVADHLADPKNRPKAIAAHCWDCVGGKADTQNPRRLVRECEITHCNLHPVRPWQQKATDEPAEEMETDPADEEAEQDTEEGAK